LKRGRAKNRFLPKITKKTPERGWGKKLRLK